MNIIYEREFVSDKPSPSRSQVDQFERSVQLISFHIAGTTISVFLDHLLCLELLFVDDTLFGLRKAVHCIFCVFPILITSIATVASNP